MLLPIVHSPKHALWFPHGCGRRRRAFTLVELLAVMTVMLIVLSLTLPSIGGVLTGRSLSGSIDRSWNAVAMARQEAITNKRAVALLVTTDRQNTNADKSDAFMLLEAQSTVALDGTTSWKWQPTGSWLKLPHGVQVAVANEQGSGFYSATALPSGSSYSNLTNYLPKLEGDTVSSYAFVVFRPDGSVDTASSNPLFEFKRLRAGVKANEYALVLSPDMGRVRLVQY